MNTSVVSDGLLSQTLFGRFIIFDKKYSMLDAMTVADHITQNKGEF